ncbi:response regulator transcription factor [Opitutales bacterium ASA1]|uniref:response regulator transcription factor n=1 Tax=Congregicoccus parvus TaxID=3081749 RepID=UPI002B2816AC|nr:response regulator transcription factor [Opitutales bacterium ASA1]
MRHKILVIDDEEDIGRALSHSLGRAGFKVESALDGVSGLRQLRRGRPDVVLLDLMLPGIEGVELCRLIRADSDAAIRDTGVVMLTAKDEEADVLVGLAVGADDYVTKPFRTSELVARIHAVLRRGRVRGDSEEERPIVHDRITIDPACHEVRVDGSLVALTATEFRLLRVLASAPQRVFTRDQLLERVIGDNAVVIDRNIDVHVRSIRKKLGPARHVIETIRSVGYRFASGA